MKTTHRSYSEEAGDFFRLSRFIIDHNTEIRTYSTWCLGRFVDWKYGLYESKTAVPDFCNRNGHLWFDGFGMLAGFAISENGGTEFAIITLAGYRFLFEEMLTWMLANWADRGSNLSIEVTAQQGWEIKALERAGFEQKATFYTQPIDLTRNLAEKRALEDGFTIVDMSTRPDYRAQRILRDDAFSGKSEITEAEMQHELLFYNYLHQSPIYHPETDLCVMAPDGQYVSGCEALIDAHNREADIERVCTHSSFRKRGFARAVIQACLIRLQQMGIQKAYITGYSPAAVALYTSLGAGNVAKAFVYETAV